METWRMNGRNASFLWWMSYKCQKTEIKQGQKLFVSMYTFVARYMWLPLMLIIHANKDKWYLQKG